MDVIDQVQQVLMHKDNPFVGFELNGDAITRTQLIQRIDEAEKRIDRDEFTTQEELETDAGNW